MENSQQAIVQKLTKAVDKASQPYQNKIKYDHKHPEQKKERIRHHQLWLANQLETKLYHYREHIKKHGKRDKGTTRYINQVESDIRWLRRGTQCRARIIVGDDAQPTTMALTKDEAKNKNNSLHYAIEDSHYSHEKESTDRVVQYNGRHSAPNLRYLDDVDLTEIRNLCEYYEETAARLGNVVQRTAKLHSPKFIWLKHELHECYLVYHYYQKHSGQKMNTQLKGFKLYIPVFHSERHSAQSAWKRMRDMGVSQLIQYYLHKAKHISLTLEPVIHLDIKY